MDKHTTQRKYAISAPLGVLEYYRTLYSLKDMIKAFQTKNPTAPEVYILGTQNRQGRLSRWLVSELE